MLGTLDMMILFISSVTRSIDIILILCALRLIASNDSSSIMKCSCVANLMARIMRNGSSE